MKQYEVTFIVSPVLSGDEIKATAKVYEDMLTAAGCKIVHVDEIGIVPLAYPINRRASGAYFCVEFQAENVEFLPKFELALKRDERILRFLNISLDKFGVKYNQDKRDGKIGKKIPKKTTKAEDEAAAEAARRPARPQRAERPERVEAAPKEVVAAPEVVEPVAAPVAVAVEPAVVAAPVAVAAAIEPPVVETAPVAEAQEVVAAATEETTEA